jgi:hypothetical protein
MKPRCAKCNQPGIGWTRWIRWGICVACELKGVSSLWT